MDQILTFGVIVIALTAVVCSVIGDITDKSSNKKTTQRQTPLMPLPPMTPTPPSPPQQIYPAQTGLDPYQQAYLIGYYNGHNGQNNE